MKRKKVNILLEWKKSDKFIDHRKRETGIQIWCLCSSTQYMLTEPPPLTRGHVGEQKASPTPRLFNYKQTVLDGKVRVQKEEDLPNPRT